MNCRTFAKRLYDYQDETLTAPEKAEFELHRSGCERCAALTESESHTAQVVRIAVRDACEGWDASSVRLFESAERHQSRSLLAGWRIPAAIAALLIMVLLVPPVARKVVPVGAKPPLEQSVAEEQRSWEEEVQVTYETGLHAETTLISHDSGITTIIEIRVSYER